jgi:hypothetical protein
MILGNFYFNASTITSCAIVSGLSLNQRTLFGERSSMFENLPPVILDASRLDF